MTAHAPAFSEPTVVASVPSSVEHLAWADAVSAHLTGVQGRLTTELDDLRSAWLLGAAGVAVPYDINPVDVLQQLLQHGGKRTRPIMTLLGWVAADVDGRRASYHDVVSAAAAIELLHCFALVHDDVMDESMTRRGHPTVHTQAATRHSQHGGRGSSARFGDSIAVLVGDLAHSEADRLAAGLPLAMRTVWRQMVLELVAGQTWDVTGAAAGNRRLEFARLVARQKTGNYTVARPLQLGAIAAGADDAALAALEAFGQHAGEAFALRDELLGAFGDPGTTGKPADDDIRGGKPTVLLAIAATRLRGRAAATLHRLGSPGVTSAQVQLVRDAMLHAGVRDTVESMIADLIDDAMSALDTDALSDAGIAQLTRVLNELARRDR